MTTNNNKKSTQNGDTAFSEAPASWNTRYVHPSGFECQITLRCDTGSELLEKANLAIEYLRQNDCQPYTYYRGGSSQKKNNNSNGNDDDSWCPIHECHMRKWEKDGRVWYSHKVNGEWCKGK